MNNTEIKIGDGVTYHVGSDRYPYTVIDVISPTKLLIQHDSTKMNKDGDWYGKQIWDITQNPNGGIITISKRKNGYWYQVGQSMSNVFYTVGQRDMYQDPTF